MRMTIGILAALRQRHAILSPRPLANAGSAP
jgi:hypothetical protein